MTKIITYFTVGTSAFAITFGFERNVCLSILVCILCILLAFCGFKIEAYIKANGNDMLNRLIYFFTRNEKKYNIIHKHITYNCLGNNRYSFEKKYEIFPIIKDLDRFNDRFCWSAPSAGCHIEARLPHTINRVWQQEMWTCYTVFFNEMPPKRKSYSVTSSVADLVDTTCCVVPYLSNTVDKKTQCTTLIVTFPPNEHPATAKFAVFSAKAGMDPNYEESLEYDEAVGGFKRTVHYPRKGWRYVISWDK